MKRRDVLLGLAAMCGLQPLAAQASGTALLDALSSYLNGLGTVASGFTQINADASRIRGRVLIRQPGRARFEYAPPDPALVLVGAGQISIFDARSNQPPQVYPLGSTPLALLLGREIDLARSGMMAGLREEGGRLVVTGQDPQRPEQGWIDLVFARDPLALIGWSIVNAAGETTEVLLDGLGPVEGVSAFEFDIDTELERRGLKSRD
jgi:outer membrane lipoprotein-sorting protein